MVARIPEVRARSARAQPDEEARENVIDALRQLLAARFGSPPELSEPDRQRLARADDRA